MTRTDCQHCRGTITMGWETTDRTTKRTINDIQFMHGTNKSELQASMTRTDCHSAM